MSQISIIVRTHTTIYIVNEIKAGCNNHFIMLCHVHEIYMYAHFEGVLIVQFIYFESNGEIDSELKADRIPKCDLMYINQKKSTTQRYKRAPLLWLLIFFLLLSLRQIIIRVEHFISSSISSALAEFCIDWFELGFCVMFIREGEVESVLGQWSLKVCWKLI